MTLWIGFGYKVTSLSGPFAVGFRRPSIEISLSLPPADEYFKDSPERAEEYKKLCSALEKLAPALATPMIEFETDGITNPQELFCAVKNEFLSCLCRWKDAGVFARIDKFFAELAPEGK